MIIAYDNVWAKVVSPLTDDERQETREILGCLSEGYQQFTLRQEGNWDSIESFFRWGKFPTGLTRILNQAKPDKAVNDLTLPNRPIDHPCRDP